MIFLNSHLDSYLHRVSSIMQVSFDWKNKDFFLETNYSNFSYRAASTNSFEIMKYERRGISREFSLVNGRLAYKQIPI